MIKMTGFTRTSIDGARRMELYTVVSLKPEDGGLVVLRVMPKSREPYNDVIVLNFQTDRELRSLVDQIQSALNRR